MSAPHILVVPSWYHTVDRPYAGTFFRDWAGALRGAGARVGVAFAEGRSLRRLSPSRLVQSHFQFTLGEEDGIPTLRLHGWNPLAQWTPGGLLWGRMMAAAIEAYAARAGRPDVVLAQATFWAGLGAQRAHRRGGPPYLIHEVATSFGVGEVRGRALDLARAAQADAAGVLAISSNLQARLRAIGGAREVPLVPCTVDADYWTLPPVGRLRRPFTFYAQAHLVPRKGFHLLLEAFAARLRGASDVRLLIGGEGGIRPALEAQAHALGLTGQVAFLGALRRDEVRAAMWAADCFVLPSLSENFGVVLIEALATGLPVIATRCGGPEDFVTRQVGWLLEPGAVGPLGEALVEACEGPAYPAAAVRAHAVRRFGSDAVGAALRQACERVMAAHR